MFRVERTKQLADKIFHMQKKALHVAHHAQAGQFAMFSIEMRKECIPLSICAVKGDCVHFIFMAIGNTTEQFGAYKRGDSISDGPGPLGKPGEIAKGGTCAVVEGGI